MCRPRECGLDQIRVVSAKGGWCRSRQGGVGSARVVSARKGGVGGLPPNGGPPGGGGHGNGGPPGLGGPGGGNDMLLQVFVQLANIQQRQSEYYARRGEIDREGRFKLTRTIPNITLEEGI